MTDEEKAELNRRVTEVVMGECWCEPHHEPSEMDYRECGQCKSVPYRQCKKCLVWSDSQFNPFTGDGMLRVIEKMLGRNAAVRLKFSKSLLLYEAWFSTETRSMATAKSYSAHPPIAVALAAVEFCEKEAA